MKVIVNAAMSLDGKIATVERMQTRISGETDFERVDSIRADVDAIMIGSGTVGSDNPHLTVKSSERIKERVSQGKSAQPARIIAASNAQIDPSANVLDETAETFILVCENAPEENIESLTAPTNHIIVAGFDTVDLPVALDRLEQNGISTTLIEGGGELLASAFEKMLVDEISVFIGNIILGGRTAPTLVDGTGFLSLEEAPLLRLIGVEQIDSGVLLQWVVEQSTDS